MIYKNFIIQLNKKWKIKQKKNRKIKFKNHTTHKSKI